MVPPDFGMNGKERNQPTITFDLFEYNFVSVNTISTRGEARLCPPQYYLPLGFSDLPRALQHDQPIAIGVQKNDWRARGAWRRTPEFCSAFYVAITGHTRVSVWTFAKLFQMAEKQAAAVENCTRLHKNDWIRDRLLAFFCHSRCSFFSA